jgi:hypothetical protein
MALDWDMLLIDLVRAKMCTGCKFEGECHPPESESSMEFTNLAQMNVCGEYNIGNHFRPMERNYTN